MDNEVDDIRKLLLSKAEQLYYYSTSGSGTQSDESNCPPPPKQTRVSLEFMKSRAIPGVIKRNGPDFEVSSYLASPCLPEDVLEFWKSNGDTYPTLAKIA